MEMRQKLVREERRSGLGWMWRKDRRGRCFGMESLQYKGKTWAIL